MNAVAPWIAAPYHTLGTDGYGPSDTREALRRHFGVDPASIAAAAVSGLARAGGWDRAEAAKAIGDLGLDPESEDPLAG